MLSLLLFATLGAYVDATPTSLSNTTLRAVTSSMTDSYASSSVSRSAKLCMPRICLRQAPVTVPQLTWSSTFVVKAWQIIFMNFPWLIIILVFLYWGFGKWRERHRQLNGGGGGGDI